MIKWSEKEASIRALEQGGRVDPKDLIEAARAEGHPCHGDFTWDIKQAANQCWRDQARKLIRRCSFRLAIEHIEFDVVAYVSSPDDDTTFRSLPKLRSKTDISAVLAAEVANLHGVASRVYGIARAKVGIVGEGVVVQLGAIKDQLADLKETMNE